MEPVRITAKNFLSFQELEYDFKKVPYLIQGENLTDENQKSNGSGKSALKSIIEACLLGKTSRNVKDRDLIFWGEKEAEISLILYCPIRDEFFTIIRKFFLKDSSKLGLSISDSEGKIKNVDFSTIPEGNKKVIEWVGISKEDLQNYFILDKYRYKSFFISSNRENSELIGRFSNADIVKGIDKDIEQEIEQDLQPRLDDLNSQLDRKLGAKETYEQELGLEQERDLEQERENSILNIQESIKFQNSKIDEFEDSIWGINVRVNEKSDKLKELSENLKEVQEKVNKVKVISFSEDISKAQKEIQNKDIHKQSLRTKVRSFDQGKRELLGIISEVEKTLMGKITCPKCGFEFIPSGDKIYDVQEQLKTKKETEELLNSIEGKLKELEKEEEKIEIWKQEAEKNILILKDKENSSYKIVSEMRKSISNIESEKFNLEGEIKRLELKKSNYLSEIESKKENIKSQKKEIEGLKNKELVNPRIKELKGKIKEISAQIKNIQGELREQEIKIDKAKSWVSHFKRFNQFLAVKSLKIIQGYVNKFLIDLGSDLQVKLEGYKLLSDGTTSEKITPYILRNGEVYEYNSFSGGERARMDFAAILAIQNMVNSTHKFGGLHFLAMDEVMEGLDSYGLNLILKSLEQFEMPIWVTTHITEEQPYQNKMVIIKENGISKIK